MSWSGWYRWNERSGVWRVEIAFKRFGRQLAKRYEKRPAIVRAAVKHEEWRN
jgi:hypothetical protein